MIARRPLLLAAAAAALPARGAGLPEVVARLRTSVLPVGTYGATDSPRFGYRGTGFVVGDGNLVATNAHVLPATGEAGGERRIVVLVGGARGEVRPARVVATDRPRDLVLLKMEGAPLPPLELDLEGSAREGQEIALMGFPLGGALGFSPVTHRGIVASLTQVAVQAPTSQQLDARAIARVREGNFDVLQLDATAYPGNSGGPLFDAASGRVLGIVNMVLIKGSRESAISQPTGITYAIPVRYLLALLAETGQPGVPPQTR